MKRILALLLALMLVVSCFAFSGCGEEKKDDGKKKDKEEQKKDDNGNYGDAPDIDIGDIIDTTATLDIPDDVKFDGETITVFAPDPYGPGYFYKESLNDTPVNDAVYNRNLSVLDKLGLTVKAISLDTNAGSQAEKFDEEVIAGSHSFDFAAVHSTSACASLLMKGDIMPFGNLEYVDFKKPWWNTGLNETCAIMDENYFALSSMCYGYYNNTSCMLFNKDLAEEAKLPDLYELVRKGEWTVDKVIEITKNFSEDLDGDGLFTDQDKIAIISDDYAYMNFWLGACRQSTVELGEEDRPEIVAGSTRMETVISRLRDLFNTGKRGVIYSMQDRIDGDDEWRRAFVEGRVLFDICIVGNAVSMRDSDINFGILPLPKLNKDQERYGSWVDPWGLVLCIPSNCEDTEKTGAALEAMSYYSYQLVYPAVLEQSIYGTGTRDTESIEMLQTIYDNMFFDFGFVFDSSGTGYGDIISSLVPNKNKEMGSYIAGKKNEVETHFDDLYEKVLENYGA